MAEELDTKAWTLVVARVSDQGGARSGLVCSDLVYAKLQGVRVARGDTKRIDILRGRAEAFITVHECIGTGPLVGSETQVFLLPSLPAFLEHSPVSSEPVSKLLNLLKNSSDVEVGAVIGVHGPSGSGKTVSVNEACKHASVVLVRIPADEVLRRSTDSDLGRPLSKFRSMARSLRAHGVEAALLIEDVDEFESNLSTTASMTLAVRKASEEDELVVFMTYESQKSLPEKLALLLDHCVEVNPPKTVRDRVAVVKNCLRRVGKNVNSDELDLLATNSAGMLPCEVAAAIAEPGEPSKALNSVRQQARARVVLDSRSHGEVERSPSSEVYGLQQAVEAVEEAVVWSRERSDDLERLGIEAPRGILLYGAAGTGKTSLTKSVVQRLECALVSLDAGALVRGEVGASEENLENYFSIARSLSPCLVFIDEIESLAQRRNHDSPTASRLVSALAQELDRGEVSILAASNRPWEVDPALLRIGRFERCIHVPLPNERTRQNILLHQASQVGFHFGAEPSLAEYVRAISFLRLKHLQN
uniref:AAA+ ATPase domain-containing protein n=1 Tax=Rhodosorus marinus TaxID=101924 RepID=A0A7S3ELA9_9RHOD|mmetsp:Transcript_41956/g.164381  ORF Transcript_41956/g.164381 Transcript_41956/m.164381 type:complete len:532 (+) Transcript_41956:313-1908(+)